MSDGHDTPTAGHLGSTETLAQVVTESDWPGAMGNVTQFGQACDQCETVNRNTEGLAKLIATIVMEDHEMSVPEAEVLPHPGLTEVETSKDVTINNELPPSEQNQLRNLVEQYATIFSDKHKKYKKC